MAKYPERQPERFDDYLIVPLPAKWFLMTDEQIRAWVDEEMPENADEPLIVEVKP